MIKIIADSTCDLSAEMIERYGIGIAPLTVNIEGKEYKDRVDIQPDTLYGMIEEVEGISTAMPSPTEYIEIIREAVNGGFHEILCICMSSGTSGAYQSAEIAKEYFYEENPGSNVKIHVVDSMSMSHGSGWLVLKSAMMKEAGASFDEVAEFNEKYKTRVKHFLSVDDLDHLIRSGRLTNASAFIGKMLRIKPIMSMKNGKGAIVAKERGRKQVLRHCLNEFKRRNDEGVTDFIIIGYTSDEKYAQNLKKLIVDETGFSGDIHIMQMGVAVGIHVGLGAVSMYFVEKHVENQGILHRILPKIN